MKYKIAIIRPFFQGHFLNYFQLFLNSCAQNPHIDWIILTDNEDKYIFPKNVYKIQMSFEQAKKLIQKKLDFSVVIDRPTKLHDYKPAFGYIFSDYLKEYDFWGYSDYDIIYGNLKKFITNEMLDSYDKLFRMGHFSLYRNSEEINTLFLKEIYGIKLFRQVANSSVNCNFDDDWNGITNIFDIFEANGKKIYTNPNNESRIADLYTKTTDFRVTYQNREDWKNIIENKSQNFFVYSDGNLIRYKKLKKNWITEEFMYLHLHNRKMKIAFDTPLDKSYIIVPDRFFPVDKKISIENADSIKRKYFCESYMNYLKRRYNNLKIKLRMAMRKESR